jgi:hypothetical protein
MTRVLAFLAALLGSALPQAPPADGPLLASFRSPPDDCRPMMRWWWFGPAVTKPQLERELRQMKDAGIGGFEVQPVYPLALDDPARGIRNLPFLSPEFLDALRFTSERARELGLRMDLTLGSGWPYGGPQVSVADAASGLRSVRVRQTSRRVPLPPIGDGERLIGVFSAGTGRELTNVRDGALWAEIGPEGPADILFFIAGRTGQMVKRAAVGAEGFVLDHYSRSAVDGYLKNVGERLLGALSGRLPYAIFCDSLEVYGGDWTGDFLEEFRKRRGYDLRPLLPKLVDDAGGEVASVRHDWGKTLTELVEERFIAPLGAWARARGTRLRIQGYGIPPAALSSNRLADTTEGEGHEWKTLSASRWASSANHLYGRAVTSSETWTWLHSPSFRATPLDVKAEADRHFLQGVNQLIGHGWPYTAEGVEYPGWRFYAAAVFGPANPWWVVAPDVSLYLQRVSWALRQGKPANDVAVYLPTDDAWASFRLGQVNLYQKLAERIGPDLVGKIGEAGYGLDFFDDRALDDGRVEKDTLVLGENRYRIVVLPGVETIPPSTLRKLSDLASNGVTLVAARRAAADPRAHFVSHEVALPVVLPRLVQPDLRLDPLTPDIGFVHRTTGSEEIYFLANTANTARAVTAAFRVAGLEPDVWNPLDGSAAAAAVVERAGGTVSIRLDLEPYGSRIVVFSRRAPRAPSPAAVAAGSIDLGAGWQVSFGSGAPLTMDRLKSWTEDETTRYYSGTASYERDFTVEPRFVEAGMRARLDLGETRLEPAGARAERFHALVEAPVRDAAVVYLDGRRAGSAWCPPYALDVTGLLKPGANRIRIVVGNTAINSMAGRSLPDYKLLNLRYGVRFEPQDMKNLAPLPSGLLGGIRINFSRDHAMRQGTTR